MTEEEKNLAIFRETKALQEGHFVLRSGLHSGHFFQCARVCEHLDKVELLVAHLLKKINTSEINSVLGVAMGGLVIGQEVARQIGRRFIFVEKKTDMLTLRRGFQIQPKEQILLVEDVITRGGRVQEAIDIVKREGGQVQSIAVFVDRSEGKARFEAPLFSLLNLSFPTYHSDALPEWLKAIPVVKPGS